MSEAEMKEIIRIYLTENRETTHSEECWKWHDKCCLRKTLQAYLDLCKAFHLYEKDIWKGEE